MIYLALLLAIACLGVVTAHAVQLSASLGRRDAEEDLLSIGDEFSRALQSYARATSMGLPRAPTSLEDLVRDPRFPGLVRHLRRIPPDPLTGKSDWVLLRDPAGRVVGVHSASRLAPFRAEGPRQLVRGAGGRSPAYSDWVFWGPLEATFAPEQLSRR